MSKKEIIGFNDSLVDEFKKKFNHQAVLSLNYTIKKRFELFLSDADCVHNAEEAGKARLTSVEIEKLLEQYRMISKKYDN